jgi:hypothetical protein
VIKVKPLSGPDPKEPVPQDCGIATIITPGETGGNESQSQGKPH